MNGELLMEGWELERTILIFLGGLPYSADVCHLITVMNVTPIGAC